MHTHSVSACQCRVQLSGLCGNVDDSGVRPNRDGLIYWLIRPPFSPSSASFSSPRAPSLSPQVVAEVHDMGFRLSRIESLLRRHGFDVSTEQQTTSWHDGLVE